METLTSSGPPFLLVEFRSAMVTASDDDQYCIQFAQMSLLIYLGRSPFACSLLRKSLYRTRARFSQNAVDEVIDGRIPIKRFMKDFNEQNG